MRIIHFADIHIGVELYGKIDNSTQLNTRLLDFEESLSFVIDTAIKEKVDLAIFAGDGYKNHTPTPTYQQILARQIRRLNNANIPLVGVVGNHDIPSSSYKASSLDVFSLLGDNTYILSHPKLLQVQTKSGPIQIACIPWLPNISLEYLKEILAEFEASRNFEEIGILLSHISLSEATLSGSERSISIGVDFTAPSKLFNSTTYDYIALGHIHKFQDLNKGHRPPIVYSGSIDYIDFGEAKEQKGFCLIDITKYGETKYKFIHTPTRKLVDIEIKIHNNQLTPTKQILQEIEKHFIKDCIVRVTISNLIEGIEIDFDKIIKTLDSAHYLAGIITEYNTPNITRTTLTEKSSYEESVDSFLNDKKDWVNKDKVKQIAITMKNNLLEKGGL